MRFGYVLTSAGFGYPNPLVRDLAPLKPHREKEAHNILLEQSCVKSNMVLSEGSCTGKLRSACSTTGAVNDMETGSRTEMQIVTETQKEQA